MATLQSYVSGRWESPSEEGTALLDAATGEVVAAISSAGIDMGAAVDHARTVGGQALRNLTFHQRASMLKALATHLGGRLEPLYALSIRTGATRSDSWVDIEGGIGVLHAYSGIGRREMPNSSVLVDGEIESLSRDGSFLGLHIATPLHGVAVQINAFNFPVWGMLEKLAPSFLAGMPTIVKPASQTAYLAEAAVREIIASEILPAGAVQLISGDAGDLLDHLDGQDTVSFTGSAATAAHLRRHAGVVADGVRFTAEADSLNSAILAPSAIPGTPEFDLFVDAVASEMTVKAGQKCTAIRRIIVPDEQIGDVTDALRERLSRMTVGNPADEATQVGALASLAQRDEVISAVARLAEVAEIAFGPDDATFSGIDVERGAFMSPTLLVAPNSRAAAVHDIEAFGPVSTLMGYSSLDDAVDIAALGRGSLVATVCSANAAEARDLTLGIAAYHGRVHVLDAASAASSTGHGSPLPQLVHGGPGRAGGGEELGGIRGVMRHMQRTAVQGSPDMLTAITGVYVRGATRRTDKGHPFKLTFDDLDVGDAIETDSRTVTIDDIERFADLTGDTFYAHMDDVAAKASPIFEGRVAHGYFVLSAAAGLFVWPDPGPVLANTGLDRLRFLSPTYPGDEMRVVLTCKEKKLRDGAGYGEVRWDAVVLNQNDDAAATYELLTMIACAPT